MSRVTTRMMSRDEIRDSDDHDQDDVSGLRNQPLIRETGLVTSVSPQVPRYITSGELPSNADVNLVQLAPSGVDNQDLDVLTVTVRSTDAGGFIPEVDVLSSAGEVLISEVLANGNGTLVLQVKNVDPRESYVVRVKAADSSPSVPVRTIRIRGSIHCSGVPARRVVRGHVDE